jgi:hypothetical protein
MEDAAATSASSSSSSLSSSSSSSSIFTNYPLISALVAFAIAQSTKFFTAWYLSLIMLIGLGCFWKISLQIGSDLALVLVSKCVMFPRFGIQSLVLYCMFGLFVFFCVRSISMLLLCYFKNNCEFAFVIVY